MSREYPARPIVGIGIVVLKPDAVLLVRRGKAPSFGQWALPGGGQELGETAEECARRELAEETGVVSTEYLGSTEGWFTYDFPVEHNGSKAAKGWRGQRQVWFALRFLGAESEINLYAHKHVEFDDWRWADLEEATELVVPFKRETYTKVVEAFRPFTRASGR